MIGDRMKEARLRLGYSAEQVAAFLGTSPATIYRYENGDISKLPSKYIKPLADFLCVTPAYLMGWSDSGSSSVPDAPVTHEARIISFAVDSMPPEHREKALKMFSAVYSDYIQKAEDKIG